MGPQAAVHRVESRRAVLWPRRSLRGPKACNGFITRWLRSLCPTIWRSCSINSTARPMESDTSAADAADFKRQLAETIPHLRAFARSLCGRPDFADDLVQDALLKAWAARDRFEPGTNLRAWTFTILRNCYLTEMRRNKF